MELIEPTYKNTMEIFTKRYSSPEELVQRLKSRGLVIENDPYAAIVFSLICLIPLTSVTSEQNG